jgi:hypothetical protein
MATVKPFVLVTIGGTFGTGTNAEIWQIGIKMARNAGGVAGGGNLNSLTDYVNSIFGGVSTWWTTSANLCRADFNLTYVKAANITGGQTGKGNPGGKYAGTKDNAGGPNPAVHTFASVPGGATLTGFAVPPPFVTLAVTLRNSQQPKGPRHSAAHGRFYAPFRIDPGGTSRIANTAPYGTSAAALLTALSKNVATWSDQTSNDIRPVLVGSNNDINLVDQVSVGDVVDTIRRRKSKLRDVYTTTAWS